MNLISSDEDNIRKFINFGKMKIHKIDFFDNKASVYDMCITKDKIICSDMSFGLRAYQDLGKYYRQFETVNILKLDALGVTYSNKTNKIYFAHQSSSLFSIIMTDYSFRILKKIGKSGEKPGEFLSCRYVACNDNYFFATDGGNCRIQIFTLDLKYVDMIELDYESVGYYAKPEFIQVSNKTICFSDDSYTTFYDINTRKLINKIKANFFKISYVNNYFYLFDRFNKAFLKCDDNGDLIDKIIIEEFCQKNNVKMIGAEDGSVGFYINSLIISSETNKCLFEFKIEDDKIDIKMDRNEDDKKDENKDNVEDE